MLPSVPFRVRGSFAAALLVLAPAAAQAPEGAVRCMTFNIRYGTANDGADRWNLRAPRVLDRIRAAQPDVLGLQEALLFQVQQLHGALPEYTAIGVHRRGGTSDESCKLLVRSSRLAVEDSGTFWLSETPDEVGSKSWNSSLPRICTWAVLRDRRRHNRFVVANTHFDHRSAAARLGAARLISAWSKIFQLPVLVMGDLNAEEGSAPVRWLLDNGLRDTFRVVHPDRADAGTWNGFAGVSGRKIDHVLCSKEFTVHAAAIDQGRVDGRFPSDHCPVMADVSLPGGPPPKLVPVLDGDPWHIGDNPDLGGLQGERQEVVDHAVFQSSDGQWHLWACIRGVKIGRLLYAWEGDSLEQVGWKRTGIAMRASAAYGESIDDWGGKEWIQAPHVTRLDDGRFAMLYGGHRSELEHCQINLALSTDGRRFVRHKDAFGRSRVFVGPGEARDPMVLRIGGKFYCYYSGNPDPRNRRDVCGVYCRISTDMVRWSDPRRVCWGGSAGRGMWSAECPQVVEREGWFYLFRTTSYRAPLTHVYRSKDPLDFGQDEDSKKIGTIAVAAPEVVTEHGRDYISTVHDLKGGVQLYRLKWVPEGEADRSAEVFAGLQPLWGFEDGSLDGWQKSGTAFEHQPTYQEATTTRAHATNAEGRYYVGTYEKRPRPEVAAGEAQGDGPQGRLRSPAFKLPDGYVGFRIGGGRDRERVYVALCLADGTEVFRATGKGSNAMEVVVWDVAAHAGKEAYLEVVDAASGAWGHINFDDVRVTAGR